MSYESMVREEMCCDYPGCRGNWDTTRGARVAIVKEDEILSFCTEHAKVLLAKGVKLRPIDVIHAECMEAKERPRREASKRARIERERRFIESLKS